MVIKLFLKYGGYQWETLSQIIRKSDYWILPKPNKFKILGSFSIIYVAIATIEILHLT